MAELPLLATVTLALPSKLQAIEHIPHIINRFLVPSTIDAAVYLDLQMVTKVFESCRPWTVGAMDGAASRGRLDIVKRLFVNRSEGCSAAALTGAAANNHLDVVEWLIQLYGRCSFKYMEALMFAAAAGHLRVVKFLVDSARTPQYRMLYVKFTDLVKTAVMNEQIQVLEYLVGLETYIQSREVVTAAVEAAAMNGLTEVMKVLLQNVRRPDSYVADGLQHAAAAGHADVVTLLLELGGYIEQSADISVVKAAEGGHMKVVFMLLRSCGEGGAGRALTAAVANNRNTLVEFLVRFCSPSQVAGVAETANKDQRELLAKYDHFGNLDNPADEMAYTRLVSAVAGGNEHTVKTLMHHLIPMPVARIEFAVEIAAALSESGVVKMVLNEFSSSPGFPDLFGVKPALKRALEDKNLDMAGLLTTYCDGYFLRDVLTEFVTKYKVEAVKVLKESSYKYSIATCAVKEYLDEREAAFSVLLEFIQENTVLEVSDKLAKAGKLEFVKRGLISQQKLDKLFAEAVASGTTELVKFLSEEMNGGVNGLGLLTAARLGHVEVVKVLLGKSEPWDTQFHALEEAAKAGKANVVEYLRQWCGPARVTAIIAGLRATGEVDAAALLDTKRVRLE